MNRIVLTEESKAVLAANQEFTDKWIAGLRSGKYVQIQESMIEPDIPKSACCLMVMEMECNDRSWMDVADFNERNIFAEMATDLPDPYKFKVIVNDLYYPEDLQARVYLGGDYDAIIGGPVEWNDGLNLSFKQIATLLETGELEYE